MITFAMMEIIYSNIHIVMWWIPSALCHTHFCYNSTRTLPWLCTWGTTGRMSVCHLPAALTRAWRLMVAWWRKSGSRMFSLCTRRGPLFTIPPLTISCCVSFLMDMSSTAWGVWYLWQHLCLIFIFCEPWLES